MTQLIEIRLPDMPECWQDCGQCAAGDLLVYEFRVEPGDRVQIGDTLFVMETDKTTLDIPSPHAGLVIELLVDEGDLIDPELPILSLLPNG